MKAAFVTAPHEIEIREVERPSPRRGEALVEVEAVGVCGSDLHAYEGTQPFFQYPEIGGHEVVGTIIEIVEGEAPEIPNRVQSSPPQLGDRVVLDPSMPCGECYPCRTGHYNCCVNMRVLGVHAPGAFAEYFCAPVPCLHVVSADLSADAAVMVEPLSIGVQATTRARITVGDTVLVIGAGTIGLCVLLAGLSRSERIAVSDLATGRLEIARSLGAGAAINAAEEDVAAAFAAAFGGSDPAIVIEAVGRPATVRQALELVAASGRVVMLGLCSDEICIPGALMVRKELDFLGSRLHGGTVPRAIELAQSGDLPLERLVTHHMKLDQLEDAFRLMLDEPDTTLKVILTP
ncbi:MAG: alcohol dehydrogenase catalytic domain-containing protein [candidate division WS1 bacterium]|jgi:L-gulonate 5-dehydrogenase|nr:alcohol dehydrogenase catalytic domain-containing protein [candidate division WS1 bacterium]